MTAVLGHYLLGFGAVLTFVSAALNLATRDGTTVRAIGRAVNAAAGLLTRPLRRFHAHLGEPPTARCARRGHRVTWDGYHEHCTRCDARKLLTSNDAGTRREWCWTYLDDPTVVPEPIRSPRSPLGVSTLADDLRRSSNWFVEAWVAEAGRALDEARYARPREYGRLGDPLRDVRIDRVYHGDWEDR